MIRGYTVYVRFGALGGWFGGWFGLVWVGLALSRVHSLLLHLALGIVA